MNIILASKSPRRKKILKNIFKDLKIVNPDYNENTIKDKEPENYCMNIALGKASSVSKIYPQAYIISADTIVYLDENILGKPKNKSEAIEYLSLLSGNQHKVYTGVTIINANKKINEVFFDMTSVYFNKLTKQEIEYYINNYHPFDKAGSYGIQDWSKVFIKKIDGCFYNVVGFPLPKFYKLFNNQFNFIDK